MGIFDHNERFFGPIKDEYIGQEDEEREVRESSGDSYISDMKRDLLESSRQKEKKKALAAICSSPTYPKTSISSSSSSTSSC